MTKKRDLINWLRRCPAHSPLFAVVQEAIQSLSSSWLVKIEWGSELTPSEEVLSIYSGRLKRLNERNIVMPGLAETVSVLSECNGGLVEGFADSGPSLIYFWKDQLEIIVGCVIKNYYE